MSKSDTAKKPLSKATQSLNESLKRRRGVRDLAVKFLIVCEDRKSAVHYFEALVDFLNLDATSVRVAHCNDNTQPIQVVTEAIRLKKKAGKSESGTVGFKQVWCVLDGDYGSKINNARERACKNDVHLAVSTMCFEYWVLLHFEKYDKSTLNCDQIKHILKQKHIPTYDKGKYRFQEVVKNVNIACERARQLRRKPGIDRNNLPENQNPSSEVYKLVDAILQAIKANE